MSDRFYSQMCQHYDIAPWELNLALWFPESDEYNKLVRKSMPKVTRKDLAKQFKEITSTDIDISKLPLATALDVVDFVNKGKKAEFDMPEGRRKDPYITVLQDILGKLDFSTATVAVMKGILEVIKQ